MVDKRGFPWDSRIHAGSRATVADGTWRKKPKTDQALVDQVEAELRQLMGAPAAPPAPPNAFASSPPPAGAVAGLPNAAPVPPMGAAPSPTADPKLAYVALIGRVAAAVPAGKITQEEVTQCCQQFGVPALPLAGNRLDLIPHIAASVDAIIAARS
jgi:cytochrome c5